jgi:two-component system sensor histidine kinase AtoS
MARRHKSKYESEVHLGFLAIAFLLVSLNFVSNYVLHQARITQRDETRARLRRTAMVISRELEDRPLLSRDRSYLTEIRDRNGLVDLALLPVKPDDSGLSNQRDWLAAATRFYPPREYPGLANDLFQVEYGQLMRAVGNEYYYVHPIPGVAHVGLLVLATDCPELAYLEDSSQILVAVLIGALIIVASVYVLLSRFMFRPFRRIREHAEQAGRSVASADDETEAVVEEYERVIGELTRTQTELLRLNDEIRHRANVLELINRSLAETSHLGVVTLDLEGKVVAANDTAARLVGGSIEEGSRQSYELFLSRLGSMVADVRRAFRDEHARGYHEYVSTHGRQGDTVIGATITEIRDPEQGMTGLLLMLSDQSELQRLRKELENQQRLAALGEMAGGLAHQIRNSLGAIGGYAALAKKRLKQAGLGPDGVDHLLDETQLANVLIDRFLSFARPLDMRPENTDLAGLITECLTSIRVRQDLHGVHFKDHLESGVQAATDSLLLRQALANLLDNAVNAYGEGGGVVDVSLRAVETKAVVEIRDYGCGISPDIRDKIFTPFYSSRPSGTGLGLSLVAKIVALHQGTVSVLSEPGQGACFTLVLPLSSPALSVPASQEITVTA